MKKSVNERVKEAMKEQGVDLLLITPSSDMVYLLGKCMMSDERLNVYVVPAEGAFRKQKWLRGRTAKMRSPYFWSSWRKRGFLTGK